MAVRKREPAGGKAQRGEDSDRHLRATMTLSAKATFRCCQRVPLVINGGTITPDEEYHPSKVDDTSRKGMSARRFSENQPFRPSPAAHDSPYAP